ncbi:DUF2510 domain-containing protein [Cellulomonas edaphi]|uniref:DUF2510 domain-containing protein n=1 Tax=Cellulomonas edaphi TaxID=3053468 RepID=A0ABT7S399_9CELL|nr:DUF2510 domain-containing protein [Cellulomons edaphi]MDM7830095.1 DUF2510 domain-containing protein [Cellulomons edaphi]
MSTAPAGWYPDHANAARLRYWDGERWTGYLVDRDRLDVVYQEPAPWTPAVPGSLNVPMSISLSLFS